MSFLSSSGDVTTQTAAGAYAPAVPGLNQILSEATNIYNQGVGGSGYVAPTTQTLQGISQSEELANLAAQEKAATLSGSYLNPFLSPIIQQAGTEAYGQVASQFSGAGRTPGGVTSQQQVASQIAQQAMPYAFQSYENERGRQLQTAAGANSLTSVGQTLEGYERQRQQAPYENLLQYANVINPVARGGAQGTQQSIGPQRNAFSSAAGGAMMGGSIGNMIGGSTGAMYGAGLGALGGLL